MLARDLTVVVEAGTVWHIDFRTQGGVAAYDYHRTDDSSVDIGFMRTQNVEEFADGSSATVYGWSEGVGSASEAVTLDAGAWSLVISCNNTFADCDGILDGASFWSA